MAPPVPFSPHGWKVLLLPSGLQFHAQANKSLVLSALDAGIRLPNSCRSGACRTCLCKLQKGNIRYLTEWPGVTREEKAEGWILPCVAVAESDLVVEVQDVQVLK
jgi:ferredoxin